MTNACTATQRLLVGAPRDNFSDRPEVKSPGNVYKCAINLTTIEQGNCEPIRLRSEEFTLNFGNAYEENGQLLGASILIAGNNVVVCAPLWKDLSKLQDVGIERLPGYCYQMNSSLLESSIRKRRFYTEIFNAHPYYENKVLTGFSSSVSQVPNLAFVLGMPGVIRDIGGIAMCDPRGTNFRGFYKPIAGNSNRQILENFHQGRGSYIGYAVASGYFGPNRKALIVASAPHFSNANGHIGSIGALYGASLLVVDINGDDIDDLLVGSPQYHTVLSAIDQGEVTVYHGTGDDTYLREHTRLYGLQKPFSRFGTSIASLGDITGDGFNDTVVGAPFEDDMTGAIYIFNGGVNGINAKFSQRISGEMILPDIAVGAYQSNKVIVVRSRPVVTVSSNISVTPAVVPLVPNNSPCMDENGMPCVTIQICFSYSAKGLNNGVYVCKTDLNIEIQSNEALIIGEKNEQNVEIKVENKGDTSYASSLYIDTSNNTVILGIQLLQGSKQLECVYANVSDDYELRCDVVQPLRRGNIVHFLLRLNTSLDVLLPSGSIQDLDSAINISGHVRSTALASNEIDRDNNDKTIQIPIQIKSDVQMSGASQPDQRKSQNKDVDLIHMYEIYNGGPSQLPISQAVVYIPVKSQSGLVLVEESKIKTQSDDVDVKCRVIYDTTLNATSVQSTTTLSPSTSVPRPRPRSLTTSDRTSKNITCQYYECARIDCTLPEINVNGKVTISIEFTVNEKNLDFKTTDVLVNFISDGILYQPTNTRMVPWSSGKITSKVLTLFFPECGFFKREKQKEAQELKRKSIAIQKRRTQMIIDAAMAANRQANSPSSEYQPPLNAYDD
ncbi:hypothetical protein KUTeg_008665 [Tegillarca granosa]|uniref:Uncharacterized protein n=1 Tax=Tegillarca granosa TaxID=220873 RepID=A0ABQ9F9R9_TEGGR|nr:hypothetical protein KUTeg_008665 [Tegillarca granosa]